LQKGDERLDVSEFPGFAGLDVGEQVKKKIGPCSKDNLASHAMA
jgi:hypothetical protein